MPDEVRAAVRDQCGDVVGADVPEGGRNSNFVATLRLSTGQQVFCKGVEASSGAARMHRREAAVNPWLPHVSAPRLLWQVEAAGWLLLGFEHIPGRHANLAPGSPDLSLIASMLSSQSRDLTPSQVPGVPPFSEKMTRARAWQKLRNDPPPNLDPWAEHKLTLFATGEPAAVELVAGDTLSHTDVHELNLLIDDTAESAHLVDWAWTHVAAAWVDTAFLVIRLIQAGHTPAEAEKWAASVDAWRVAPPVAMTAFAVEVYGMWEHLRLVDPLPIREEPTRAARRWAQFRDSFTRV